MFKRFCVKDADVLMTITLSCDHRVLDGARGAAFMHDLVEALQDPSGSVRL